MSCFIIRTGSHKIPSDGANWIYREVLLMKQEEIKEIYKIKKKLLPQWAKQLEELKKRNRISANRGV